MGFRGIKIQPVGILPNRDSAESGLNQSGFTQLGFNQSGFRQTGFFSLLNLELGETEPGESEIGLIRNHTDPKQADSKSRESEFG